MVHHPLLTGARKDLGWTGRAKVKSLPPDSPRAACYQRTSTRSLAGAKRAACFTETLNVVIDEYMGGLRFDSITLRKLQVPGMVTAEKIFWSFETAMMMSLCNVEHLTLTTDGLPHHYHSLISPLPFCSVSSHPPNAL